MSSIPSEYEFEWPGSVEALSEQPELVLRLLDFLRLDYDAIFLRDLGGTITYWNSGAERLYGWQAQQALGQRSHELLHTQFPDLPQPLDRLLAQAGAWEGELVHHHRDGRQIVVQSSTFEIVYANDAAARLCGYDSAAALRGLSIETVVQNFELRDEHGDPFPVEALPARRALTQDTSAEALIRTRAGGVERWAVSRARPVHDDRGRVAFIVSAFHDVTALKTQELRERFLDQAGAVLSTSLDYETTLARVAQLAVPDLADWASVHLIEPDGSLRQVALAHTDPARVAWAQELATRYPPQPDATTGVPQVVRSGLPEFYPEIPPELLLAVAQDPELHRIVVDELQLTSYLIVPLRTRGIVLGAITFVYGESRRHYTDAELRLAQQLAERAAQAVDNARLYRDALIAVHVRDEFLASVSHDLRTPLTTIRGSAELAARHLRRIDIPGTEGLIRIADNVVDAAERMERMIASLLDLARLESGRPVDVEPEWMDLVSLVREIATQHQRGTLDREIALETEPNQLRGYWDSTRIERVIDNLLSNAVKYSATGTPVQVRLATETDKGMRWARVDVEDHGIGIPAADLPHIFDRFFRGSNVGARTPGIGIGLAGAKQIAELHRGTLTAVSEQGAGSRFTLRLPLDIQTEET